jgi:tetratricopeptide (TPR) repeat protein
LGIAYLQAGETEKGSAIMEKVIDTDSTPMTLNNVAYELAEQKADLSKAVEYSLRAVNEEEKKSIDIRLGSLLPEDLSRTQNIGIFWDTLGWAYFRLGNFGKAEDYLYATWLLSQYAVTADHLGQVYESQQKPQKAIHMYRLGLAVLADDGSRDEIRQHMERLTQAKVSTKIDPTHPKFGGDELSQIRSVKIRQAVHGYETAEFFLLFGPGPKVEDVKFISGSENLRTAADALAHAKFQVALPQGSVAHLVRRAILSCSEVAGCSAVLLLPTSVHSLK